VRARDAGIEVGTGEPGLHNAITDVAGVRVGHATLVSGSGEMVVGQGSVRTGITVALPHGGRASTEPVFAGYHRLNGFGELTGLEWLHESGMPTSPIALPVEALALPYVDAKFAAVIEATAEAILDAMLQAETMSGRDDLVLRALNGAQLAHILDQHGQRRYSVR